MKRKPNHPLHAIQNPAGCERMRGHVGNHENMIELIPIQCPLIGKGIRICADMDWLPTNTGGPLPPESLIDICACFEAHAGKCPHHTCRLNAVDTVLASFDPVPIRFLNLKSGSDMPFSEKDLESAFDSAGVSKS